MKRAVICSLAVLAVAGVVSGCRKNAAAKLVGKWVVDAEASKEEATKSPKWSKMGETEAKVLGHMIDKMLGSMSLEFTDDAMSLSKGDATQELPYKISSSSATRVVLTVEQGGKEISMTFEFEGRDRMRFKSGTTEDLDFLVWKRAR